MGKWVSITISKENYDTLTKIKEEYNLASLNETLTFLITMYSKAKLALEYILKGELAKALVLTVDIVSDVGLLSYLIPPKVKVEKVLE